MDLNPKVGYFYVYLGFYLVLITPLDTGESCQPIDEYPSIYGKDALCVYGDKNNNNYCLQCETYYKKVLVGNMHYKKCRIDCRKCEYKTLSYKYKYEIECRVCHKACLNYGCNGPSAIISNNGCKKCDYGFINGTQKTCLIGSNNSTKTCADNHLYNYFLDKPNRSEIEWTTNICRECDSNCKSCSSLGNDNDLNECECKNFLKTMKIDGEERRLCSEDCSGFCDQTEMVHIKKDYINLIMILILFGIIILISIITFISYKTFYFKFKSNRGKRKRENTRAHRYSGPEPNESYEIDQEPIQSTKSQRRHSIDESSYHSAYASEEKEPLKINGKIYTGKFFHIYQGVQEEKEIVIKRFREDIDPNNKNMLLDEFITRSAYKHLFIHSCEIYQNDWIEEFYPNRDLKTFLKHMKGNILTQRLYLYCAQIAEAMHFLKEKKIIHGKLTAKEILVKNEEHIELANLGLAIKADDNRELTVTNMVPWHCLSLEQLESEKPLFTFETDIWAFGVTCWEIFTFGKKSNDVKQPYAELNVEQGGLIRFLRTGRRLPKPNNCDSKTYDKLKNCWNIEPGSRPQFEILLQHFNSKEKRLQELNAETFMDDDYGSDFEFKNKKRHAGKVKIQSTNEAIEFELSTSEAVILEPSRSSNYEPILINDNDAPSTSEHIISNQNIYLNYNK